VSADAKLRIAVDANVLEGSWGGIPKYLCRIGDELIAGGDEIDLLANARQLDGPTPKGAHDVGLRVRGTGIWRDLALPLWLARHRPDVLWAPESVLPRVVPGPAVITIHDLAALRFPGIKPAAHVESFRTTVARSARRADRVIAVSEATAADVVDAYGIDPAKIRVVPNGVDDIFTPGDRAAALAAVRERWGIAEAFVLHVGTLEERKGVEVLIGAAELARDAGADWSVVLAGSPGYGGARLEAVASRSPACRVLGPVSDDELVTLQRAAGACAAPAIYEGFGIVPLEAMSCGTPVVIAADSGGLEEVSGAAAIVVGERSPAAWRHALEQALERPPALIERGRRHAGAFRWPAVAERTKQVLAEAAAR
jgi:glycosyltransferase involved in cell wall biosynthesis